MKLFRWHFNGKTVETDETATPTVPEIAVGSLWVIKRADGDPFPPDTRVTVEILDVKDGWVRYRIGPKYFSLFPDNRRDIKTFLNIYEEATK